MEEKPVTDLVLLPPLDLIPLESLPKRRREELALLKKERGQALRQVVYSSAATLAVGIITGLYGWACLMLWLESAPLILSLLVTLICGILSACSVFLVRESAREARAYRQMVITPQLQIDVGSEILLPDVVKRTNAQIADWNMAAEGVIRHDLGGRHLQPLQIQRGVLSTRIARIKKEMKRLADAAGPNTKGNRRP